MHLQARNAESRQRHSLCGMTGNRLLGVTGVLIVGLLGIGPVLAESFVTPASWTAANPNFLPPPESLFRPDAISVSDRTTFFDTDEETVSPVQHQRDLDQNDEHSLDEVTLSTRSGMPTRPSSLSSDLQGDRFWLINTRSISSSTCRMNLNEPNFRIERLDRCGRRQASSLEDYLSSMDSNRPRIIYIHGNRRDAPTAISQGLFVYRQLASNRPSDQPFDWVIWSWPSDAGSILLLDVREKAKRTNAQGLYAAWLLREHHLRAQPTGMIGFSFGARVVSGALHALAGGSIAGRTIGTPPIRGADIDVGFLAPAVDSTWMMSRGHHGLATQNTNRLVVLYNQRDFALKYFKLISRVPGSEALGYTGPRCFAPRYDGTQLPIRSRDCSTTVGNHHSEKRYYEHACYAGREMASLIDSCMAVD